MIGLGEALSVGCALTWAIGVIIYKRLGEHIPPLPLTLLKNLIVLVLVGATVALLMSPMAPALGLDRLAWPAMTGWTIALVLASGLIGIAVADTLYLRALNVLGAGRMGVVGNLYSPFVIALSLVFLGERLAPVHVAGFVLVLSGVLLVNAPAGIGHLSRASLRRGVATGAASVALMAIAIVMLKRVLETEPFWWIVLLRIVGAVAGLSVRYATTTAAPLRSLAANLPNRWLALIAAAFVGQYLSMAMWLAGYKYTSASVASILNESASIFIVLLAALFLGESLTWRRAAGVAITMTGVVLMI